ncbi:MAG: hypothetical protein LUG98_14070 [Tannerellaceae bacterium]|nr:hypothetical protein [Tannerellaceae bacterium]
MMASSGIVLTIVTGFLLANCISVRFTLLEKVGLSFLCGLALQTFLMLCLDMVSVPLTGFSVIGVQLVSLLSFIGVLYKRKNLKLLFSGIEERREGWKGIHLLWLLLIIMILGVEAINFAKCIYFPPFDRDSLSAFETLGYVTAQDHTLKGNILYDPGYNLGVRSGGSYISYTPMVTLSYTYVYLLGAVHSKMVNAFIYLFFLITLYGGTKRVTTRTGAAAITLFVLLAPEMIAFSSLSGTNVIQAAYVAPAVLYSLLWLRDGKKKDMYLSAFLLAANVWSRTEGIVFVAAVGVIALWFGFRRGKIKEVTGWGVTAVFPLVIWQLFMVLYHLQGESTVIARLFWDPQKAEQIGASIIALMQIPNYYGWTFFAIPVGLLSNLWYLVRKRDNLNLLLIIILSLFFYMIILYQIDYVWDSLENVLAYSAKRFLFCFVPLAWIYLFSNRISVRGLGKLDDFLEYKKK